MNEIAELLIDFGMDFQYENYGSEGEKIISFESGIEVIRQHGKVIFIWCGQRTEIDESLESINTIRELVEKACIEETT